MIELLVIIGVGFGVVFGLKITDEARNGFASTFGLFFGGIAGGFIGWIIGVIASGIIWFITTYWLVLIALCALIFSVIYALTHPSEMKMLYAYIKRLCDSVISYIKMSDHAIMRYSTRQTKKLIAIAPDFEWLDIRTSVSELGTRHIAQLLRERKSLRDAIKHVRKVLKQVAWKKKDREEFEMANARRSAQNIESLVVKLQKNEKDIAEALDMLCHLEADLAVATTEDYKRDEIKAKLQTLVSRIQANSAAVQDARTETDDYAQGRIRRLTE